MDLAEWRALGNDPKNGFQAQVNAITELSSSAQIELMQETLDAAGGRFQNTIRAIQVKGAQRGRPTPRESAEAMAQTALVDFLNANSIEDAYYNIEIEDVHKGILRNLVRLKRLDENDIKPVLNGAMPSKDSKMGLE